MAGVLSTYYTTRRLYVDFVDGKEMQRPLYAFDSSTTSLTINRRTENAFFFFFFSNHLMIISKLALETKEDDVLGMSIGRMN